MQTVMYLILGLAIIGALVYALQQVNARQRQLHAELTRLEQLSAEVTINAEAVLEQVDQRIERLNDLATRIEERAAQVYEGRQADGLNAAMLAEVAQAARVARMAGVVQAGQVEQTGQTDQQVADTLSGQPRADFVPGQIVLETNSVPAEEPESIKVEVTPDPLPPTPADRYAELRQTVQELAEQGQSPLEIAKALAIPRGEVQLMLNLKAKNPPAS